MGARERSTHTHSNIKVVRMHTLNHNFLRGVRVSALCVCVIKIKFITHNCMHSYMRYLLPRQPTTLYNEKLTDTYTHIRSHSLNTSGFMFQELRRKVKKVVDNACDFRCPSYRIITVACRCSYVYTKYVYIGTDRPHCTNKNQF